MNKMVNRLILKQKIIRRFSNESDDDDNNEDIQIINNDKTINKSDVNSVDLDTSPECSQVLNDTSPDDVVTDSKKFPNFTVFVKEFGQKTERFVDTNKDNNPFVVNELLDQLMTCKDLDEIQIYLNKTNGGSNSHSTVSDINDEQFGSGLAPNEDQIQTESSFTGDTDDFQIDAKELEFEGIKKTGNSNGCPLFKCLVCEISLIGFRLAANHIQNETHFKKKFGDDLKGLDAMFTIDSESIGDVRIAIARKKELKKINNTKKQRYLDHGIRLKNGFGTNAYICSECKISLGSLKAVQKHFKSQKNGPKTVAITKESSNSSQTVTNKDVEQPVDNKSLNPKNTVDHKLYSDGIAISSDGTQFYCIFCNIHFQFKKTAVQHIIDSRHKQKKNEENLNEIDSRFTIPSNKTDVLEVSFARKSVLKALSTITKTQFIDQSIRLEDGIGPNAFQCVKCHFSIGSVKEIQEHIRSLMHNM